jgi:hypothetical protein
MNTASHTECFLTRKKLQEPKEPGVQKSEDKILRQSVQQIRDCALQTVSN